MVNWLQYFYAVSSKASTMTPYRSLGAPETALHLVKLLPACSSCVEWPEEDGCGPRALSSLFQCMLVHSFVTEKLPLHPNRISQKHESGISTV